MSVGAQAGAFVIPHRDDVHDFSRDVGRLTPEQELFGGSQHLVETAVHVDKPNLGLSRFDFNEMTFD